MGKKAFDVDIDLGALDISLGEKAIERAQKALVEEVLQDSNVKGVIPYRLGNLHDSGHVAGTDTVVWDESYANAVYNRGHSPTTKNGSSAWFETAKAAHLQDWKAVVLEELSR